MKPDMDLAVNGLVLTMRAWVKESVVSVRSDGRSYLCMTFSLTVLTPKGLVLLSFWRKRGGERVGNIPYGVVYKAYWLGATVAAKMFKDFSPNVSYLFSKYISSVFKFWYQAGKESTA